MLENGNTSILITLALKGKVSIYDMKKTALIAVIAIAVIAVALGIFMTTKNPSSSNKVLLETTEGNITIELAGDMPITAGNFEKLVKQGVYDNVIFHRVIDEFMIQGGDPTGTGYGDPSIPKIKDEFNGVQENNRGTIAMANAGPNTGSSQFFINLVDNNFLDGKHPVFGKVIDGMDVVDKIAKVETDSNDKPLKDVTILRASIV